MRGKVRYGLSIALLLVGLAACAPVTYTSDTDDYAYNVDDGRLYIRWNCVPQPSGMLVQGFVNNILLTPMKDTQLSVSGIDVLGKTVSSANVSGLPYMLQTNTRTPFAVIVQASGTEVRYDLWFNYDVGGAFMSGNDQRGTRRNACPGVRR